MSEKEEEEFWTERYNIGNTGWDIGLPSTPLVEYFDQLENKNLKILIPGAGNAHEVEYLVKTGFQNVYALDISEKPLENLQKRLPNFPSYQLVKGDFFEHVGNYDLIIEQTFFCSFEPSVENRNKYALKMHELLKPGGKLVGLWFKHPLIKEGGKRPFGGSKKEYLNYFEPLFRVVIFEDCYNSIPPRTGNELFGFFEKAL